MMQINKRDYPLEHDRLKIQIQMSRIYKEVTGHVFTALNSLSLLTPHIIGKVIPACVCTYVHTRLFYLHSDYLHFILHIRFATMYLIV